MMLERSVTYISRGPFFSSVLLSGGSVRGNFGMNRHDVTECLPSKALNIYLFPFHRNERSKHLSNASGAE